MTTDHKGRFVWAILAALGLAACHPASAQNFVNAGFEETTPSQGSDYALYSGMSSYQSGTNTTYTTTGFSFSGRSGIAGNGSAFGQANAPGGNNVGFLQTNFNQTTGSFSQTVQGFTVGDTYELTFQAAQRPTNPAPQIVTVSLFGTQAFTPSSSATYNTYTYDFVAGATSGTATFSGDAVATPFLNNDRTAFLDNITLRDVSAPEPTPVAVVGLGVLGLSSLVWRARRRTA